MKKLLLMVILALTPNLVSAGENLSNKKLLCQKLLWGFEFISSDKVNVIDTNINKETNVKEYYYETDIELPYINLYLIEKNIRNVAYSIHRHTHRVDVWTMTSGGNTTREMIPAGHCEDVKIDNILDYIENLKDIS